MNYRIAKKVVTCKTPLCNSYHKTLKARGIICHDAALMKSKHKKVKDHFIFLHITPDMFPLP